ncbi:hypothetical protein F4860DRAFT_486918 [Xylaria cubensis]|nr:hypothetical protein F4860DRAFT_486918 [Xylaria cubensis]
MAEPVGITGTAIAVATLLYGTCREIHDIISSYRGAPSEYQRMVSDLNALQDTLDKLIKSLQKTNDTALSAEQRGSFKLLETPLKLCDDACVDFKNKLSQMTARSTKDHTSSRDRMSLHFHKGDIALFREKLNTAKGTVMVALNVSTLQAVGRNQETLSTFQEITTTTLSQFSGKFEALELAVQSLSISGVAITQQDVETVTRTLNEHGKLLKQCLQFCTTALKAVHSEMPATQVRYAKAAEYAQQIVGNVGSTGENAPTVDVNTALAEGSAFQGVGNFSVDALKAILGNRASSETNQGGK